jgi:rhodanese-like protein
LGQPRSLAPLPPSGRRLLLPTESTGAWTGATTVEIGAEPQAENIARYDVQPAPQLPICSRNRSRSGTMRAMARIISRDELRQVIDQDAAQLVDVLTRDEYDEEHIPGAINLPLRELDAATAARVLDASRPMITYCHDSL